MLLEYSALQKKKLSYIRRKMVLVTWERGDLELSCVTAHLECALN